MNNAAQKGGIFFETWDINNPLSLKAWKDASATYARLASGEVYAVIGTHINPNGIWTTVELPILKQNPNVTKIVLIDPETLKETIIFVR